jgi:hypothetical protein
MRLGSIALARAQLPETEPQLRTKATMTLSTVQPAFRPFKLATISVALEPSEVRQSLVQRKIDYLAEMYCSSSGCSLAKPS